MLNNKCKPIFVVGVRRSGTTLLQLMLDSHPQISMTYETGFLPSYASREFPGLETVEGVRSFLGEFYNIPSIQLWDRTEYPEAEDVFHQMDDTTIPSLLNSLFSILAQEKGKKRWGDKTPDFVSHMQVLSQMFPGAQFIHIIRDARDVVVSRQGIRWFSNDVVKIATEWRDILGGARKTAELLGENQYLELRYEDLVKNTEQELERVCDFLGEEYCSDMLDYHLGSDSKIPSADMHVHKNTSRPPLASNCEKWRAQLKSADRMIVESIASQHLNRLGYELLGVNGKRWKMLRLLYKIRGKIDRHLFLRKW